MAGLEELSSSCSTCDEESERPPVNKKAKFAGPFKYKCSFREIGTRLGHLFSCSYQKVHTFRCNVRWKNLNCALQGPWAASVDKIIVDVLFLCIYRQTKLL